jgi:hypothetical protein
VVRRRGQAWRASTGRGLGDRAPLSNFLLVSLTSNCAGRRRAVSVAWPQSRVHARGVRPMHARAVGVGAPDPERGSAALTSSAVGGRRSEGLVRPSTASQPPLRSLVAQRTVRAAGADIAPTSNIGYVRSEGPQILPSLRHRPENTSNKPLFLLGIFLLTRHVKEHGKMLYTPNITLNPSENARWREFELVDDLHPYRAPPAAKGSVLDAYNIARELAVCHAGAERQTAAAPGASAPRTHPALPLVRPRAPARCVAAPRMPSLS